MNHIHSSKNLKGLKGVTNQNEEQILINSRKSFTFIGPSETTDEKKLNNQAVYVKSLLSNFIENPAPAERKVFKINEEIGGGRGRRKTQQVINNEWGRSKTKAFTKHFSDYNQNNKMTQIPQKDYLLEEEIDINTKKHSLIAKEENFLNKDSDMIIQDNNASNQSLSLNQLIISEKNNQTSQIKNRLSSNHHYQPQQTNTKRIEETTFQEKPELNFPKLLQEKRQSQSNKGNSIHNDLISMNPRATQDYRKKITFSPMNNGASFQSNKKQIQMPYYFKSNNNENQPYNRRKRSGEKNNRTKDNLQSKDIRNVLDQSNYQAFNLLCSELKENFINKNESPISNAKSEKDKLAIADTIKINSCDERSNYKNQSNNKTIHELRYRNYLKNKPVYDSLSDEESDEELSGYYYINPNSPIKKVFDSFIILCALNSIIFTPYWLAFDIQVNIKPFSIRFLNEIIIDTLFFIDLSIGFFVAYFDFEEQFISRLELIMKNYLMGWFVIDLIAGFPFNSLFIISGPILSQWPSQFKLHELFKLLRVIKLFKVCMYNSISAFLIKKCAEIDMIARWARLYFSLIVFILSVYLLSCIFVFLGTLDYPNWIVRQGYEYRQEKADVLITSFYYICTTVFTIGYGDVTSVSTYERFFNLFLLVVGIMIYSWAVTALSNYVQSVDSKTMEYQKRMATLDMIRLSHENLPVVLYEKISRFLTYKLNNEKRDKNDIIDTLPIGLRNKLIMEMYKSIIGNFIFFKSFNNTDFIIRVLLALKPIQALKNEQLVKEGDYIEEIIFVKRGSLALEIPLPIQFSDEIINSVKTKQGDTFIKMGIPRKSIIIRPQDPNLFEMDDKYENVRINTSKTKTSHFLNYNKTSLFQKQEKIANSIQTYLKIIEIRRNEHFGDILMFLNKRSPLSVKVRSKVAELLYLKKTDAVEISMSFPTFWRKIIKKSLFNMEQIERLMNKALKFFFIHNEGNIKNGPHNYYQKDIENSNTFVNSNTLYDNPKFSEECELQSIPSLDNSYNNINSDTGIILENAEMDASQNREGKEDLISNNGKEVKLNDNSRVSKKDEQLSKRNYDISAESKRIDNTNVIIEEEEYDEDEDEAEGEIRDADLSSHNSQESSRQDTLKMAINNKNVSFSSSSSNSSNNKSSPFSFCNNNTKSKNQKIFSKGTVILYQDIALPFRKEEINNETYSYDNSIDLRSNSNIPKLIPKDYSSNSSVISIYQLNGGDETKNFFSQPTMFPQEDFFRVNENIKNSLMHQYPNDEETTLFYDNNHLGSLSDFERDNILSPFKHNSKAITFKSTSTLKALNPKFEVNEITQSASFTICSSNNNKSITSKKKQGPLTTSPSISQLSSKKTEWKSLKNKGLPKDKEKLPKCRSLQSSNTLDSRRLSQIMMSIEKHEFKNNNDLIGSNRSIEGVEEIQQGNKKKKYEEKPSTLDVISQNIEKNMMNLSNPKYFYSKYFSQVMNKTDVKDKNNQLKDKLNFIAKILENHHPKKQS